MHCLHPADQQPCSIRCCFKAPIDRSLSLSVISIKRSMASKSERSLRRIKSACFSARDASRRSAAATRSCNCTRSSQIATCSARINGSPVSAYPDYCFRRSPNRTAGVQCGTGTALRRFLRPKALNMEHGRSIKEPETAPFEVLTVPEYLR
jgi:hypothetical protein